MRSPRLGSRDGGPTSKRDGRKERGDGKGGKGVCQSEWNTCKTWRRAVKRMPAYRLV